MSQYTRAPELRPELRLASQSGFSLMELMIALVLGLMVTGVVIQVFTSSHDAYTTEEDYGRIQERGRFALEFLAFDIRQAGYSGCRRLKPDSPSITNLVSGGGAVGYPRGVLGHRYTGSGGNSAGDWTPALPNEYITGLGSQSVQLEPWSDVIIVEYAKSMNTPLAADTIPTNAEVQIHPPVDPSDSVNAGDILMITDCRNADIFKSTGVSNSTGGSGKLTIAHAASGNTSPNLSHDYDNRAEVLKLASRMYFVGRSTDAANPNPEPTLYRRGTDSNMSSLPLVEGIERLRYLWGMDTNNDPVHAVDQYVEADGVPTGQWTRVVAARIGMVINTAEERGSEPDQAIYNLFGETESNADDYGPVTEGTNGYGADNRRHRRVFTTTINVRNIGVLNPSS